MTPNAPPARRAAEESPEARAALVSVGCSILLPDGHPPTEVRARPEFFHDLQLDRIVDAVIAGREEYHLAPLFHTPLDDRDAISYRQEIMQEMETEVLRQVVGEFADRMRTMRQRKPDAAKRLYPLEAQRWFLASAEAYVDAVLSLSDGLAFGTRTSRGLRRFCSHITAYVASNAFRALVADIRSLTTALGALRFSLLIRDLTITVGADVSRGDYSLTIARAFEKFRHGHVKDYHYGFKGLAGMNQVESEIVSRVALLYPEPFAALARFSDVHRQFVDPLIARFDREIQFYLAMLNHVERLRRAGLAFCYPSLAERDTQIVARDTFDLALAETMGARAADIVRNAFELRGPERVFVVTGPTQGGKTTFARMVGQLHYLAALGCPVPGREARLLLCDHVFAVFERQEDPTNLRGKLEDDLLRLRDVLRRATSRSLIIINEIFTSTTLEDALFLGRAALRSILELDGLCVFVTFLDELAAPNAKIVSMVATVEARDPTIRTFKIERRSANGLAYALAIAEKHHVTDQWLARRLGR